MCDSLLMSGKGGGVLSEIVSSSKTQTPFIQVAEVRLIDAVRLGQFGEGEGVRIDGDGEGDGEDDREGDEAQMGIGDAG